jgi:HPt (histidine-containing phosphotransfer) domain-containing protein
MDMNEEAGKPYDLTSIFAISDNNPQFLEKLLLIFAENISNDLRLINEAANTGNWQAVGQLAHKMKPSLTHFGINSLQDVIRNLEHPAGYDVQHLNSLVAQLNSVINKVLTGLKNEFSAIFKQ